MTHDEYIDTYYKQVGMDGLGTGFAYDTDQPTFWNEKLAYMLCGLIDRMATAEIKVSAENAPGYGLSEAISLVIPKISLRTDKYELVVENEGANP